MEHRERLEQIWAKLWVFMHMEVRGELTPEEEVEKNKLLAEMDELDPAGIGILESLREDENGRSNAEHMDSL